jgi:hypothetical protein
MRCRTRVVPLRTVNESLNGDAMRERLLLDLPWKRLIALCITSKGYGLLYPCFLEPS